MFRTALRNLARPEVMALALLAPATHLAPPATLGAVALAVTGLVASGIGGRLDAATWFARLAVVCLIFGASAVALIGVAAALAVAVSRISAARAPALAVPIALVASAGAAGVSLVFGGSDLAGPVFAVLVLGAPGAALERLAGPAGPDDDMLDLASLGASLVGMVLGAFMLGIVGAAAAIAAAMVAAPFRRLASRPDTRRRRRRTRALLGALASGAAGVFAILAMHRLAGDPLLGALAAAAAAVCVQGIALRVHAPALARLQRRALRAPRPAAQRPKLAQDWQARVS